MIVYISEVCLCACVPSKLLCLLQSHHTVWNSSAAFCWGATWGQNALAFHTDSLIMTPIKATGSTLYAKFSLQTAYSMTHSVRRLALQNVLHNDSEVYSSILSERKRFWSGNIHSGVFNSQQGSKSNQIPQYTVFWHRFIFHLGESSRTSKRNS